MFHDGLKAVALLAFSLLPAFSTSAALIGHWTGNGTANDASGNAHDGTLFGDTTFAPGVIGSGFSFDGTDDYVAIGSVAALEPSTITVAAFVQMPDTGATQRLVVDSSHGFGDSAGWALQTETSGAISFVYGNGAGFQGVTSTTLVDDNQFHHIAGVLDAGMMHIYVNGALENSVAFTGAPLASGRELRIGASWGGAVGGAVREVNGVIDEVRVYDNALSLAEIQVISAVPEPSSLATLLVALALAFNVRRRSA